MKTGHIMTMINSWLLLENTFFHLVNQVLRAKLEQQNHEVILVSKIKKKKSQALMILRVLGSLPYSGNRVSISITASNMLPLLKTIILRNISVFTSLLSFFDRSKTHGDLRVQYAQNGRKWTG